MATIESTNHSLDHEADVTLEEEIKQVRSQIQELTKRRRLITNTLLGSTNVQNQLKTFTSQEDSSIDAFLDLPRDDNPLSTTSTSNSTTSTSATHLTNMHRLSFTVTAFPFTDPSPHNSHLNGSLLGIRIDHCSRLGIFGKPFYILLRRVERGADQWRIHRHTLPAFIQLKKLEDELLPLSEDSGYGGSDGSADSAGSTTTREQNLPGFVRKVRHEIICWSLRREAIDLLKEQVNLVPAPSQAFAGHKKDDDDGNDEENGGDISMSDDGAPEPLYGILSIEPTAFEARQARITWTDGTVARIKISDRGVIERAVVVGVNGRIRGVENLLVDGESRIEGLVEKLKVLVGEGQ